MLLVRHGEHSEGEGLAREVVALGAETDSINWQADAYADLGKVLALAGRPKEAAAALEQALTRYERKANVVMAGRTNDRLAALPEDAPL